MPREWARSSEPDTVAGRTPGQAGVDDGAAYSAADTTPLPRQSSRIFVI